MISEILASHLNVPWQKEEIEKEMGNPSKIRRKLFSNTHFTLWSVKNFIFGSLILFRMPFDILKKQGVCGDAILVYSLVSSQVQSSASNLREFLSDPRISLNEVHNKEIIVEIPQSTPKVNLRDQSLRFVRNIPEFFFRERLDPKTRVKVILRIYLRVIKSLVKFQVLDLVFMRQAIVESEVNLEISTKIQSLDLITTQSSIRRLPSIFYLDAPKPPRKIMIWYSNNSNVIEHKSDASTYDTTRDHRGNIDLHLVWGEHWRNQLLAQNPNAVVKAVGSLMLYPPMFEKKSNRNTVLLFDVIPITNFKHYNFYSRELILGFLNDLIECVEKVNSRLDPTNRLSIVIKQKRKYTKYSDELFIADIESMIQDGYLSMSPPESNLYELISSARMVIGIPYVSPVFIAGEFGIQSCYYISEKFSDWNLQSHLDGIPTVVGKGAILKWIEDQFSPL